MTAPLASAALVREILAEQRVESFDMPGCAVLETVLCPSSLHDVEVGGTCAHGCGTPDECSDCPGALP